MRRPTDGGAHKINNTLGQGVLADEAGKNRLIAETGAGQHGTATAMVGALLNLDTEIYMGKDEIGELYESFDLMRYSLIQGGEKEER